MALLGAASVTQMTFNDDVKPVIGAADKNKVDRAYLMNGLMMKAELLMASPLVAKRVHY